MHAVQMLISLMASTTSTTTTISNNEEKGHEATMQKIWAEAYEAWVNVPGSSDRVLYFKPVAATSSSSSFRTSSLLSIPEIVQQSVLFGITAWDPMGVVEVDPNVNAAANEKMELVLKSMMTNTVSSSPTTTTTPSPPRCSIYWHGYGLSSDGGGGGGRKEAGFIVAFPKEDCIMLEQAEAAMVALAKEFNQGAIYRFEYIIKEHGEEEEQGSMLLRRKTISAAMSNSVEAQVVIVRCEKPDDIAAIINMDDLL
jgi:hypothetical protein